MPIYEYQCQKCQHQFETIRKISDPPLVTCPTCGADSLKKLVSKAAFRLKGGGWYETDFKSGSKKNVLADEKTSGDEKKSGEEKEKKSGDGAASKDASKSASDAPAKASSESAKPAKSESSD
jgi:putative FmdB family regulatory protein